MQVHIMVWKLTVIMAFMFSLSMVLNSVISVIQDIFLVYVKFCVCKENIFCVLLSFFLRVIVSDNYNNFLILNTVP